MHIRPSKLVTAVSPRLRSVRSQFVLVFVVVVSVVAAGAITLLERHVDDSNRAQAEISALQLHLVNLENAPISATQTAGGSNSPARAKIEADSRSISMGLASLIDDGAPPAALLRVQPAVRQAEAVVKQVFAIGAGSNDRAVVRRELPTIIATVRVLQVKAAAALALLTDAGHTYNQRAATAKREAIFGSIATIILLLAFFVLFYRQAHAARAENRRLLEASRDEAVTDPLSGIGNRRAFKRDLERILPAVSSDHELIVAMFDLDGFKQYNDTFGHGAGDALLARLAGRLKHAAGDAATAYRVGGDEFCLVTSASGAVADRLVQAAVEGLSDAGEGWRIGCSWGVAAMPSDATGASDALALADERMYAQKTKRVTAGLQATAALVQVLIERDVDLSTHINRVAELSVDTARELGLPEHEITRIGLAAQLHDIGKTAIPESLLSKAGPLDDEEWAFMRRHTLIGERIIAAAPSLAHTANLVRSSHERVDGEGYPDRLAGPDIPLGSRIIAVCDAFDAIVAPRPYRDPATAFEAIAELQHCAGTQFDPAVVDAFRRIAPKHGPGPLQTGRCLIPAVNPGPISSPAVDPQVVARSHPALLSEHP